MRERPDVFFVKSRRVMVLIVKDVADSPSSKLACFNDDPTMWREASGVSMHSSRFGISSKTLQIAAGLSSKRRMDTNGREAERTTEVLSRRLKEE